MTAIMERDLENDQRINDPLGNMLKYLEFSIIDDARRLALASVSILLKNRKRRREESCVDVAYFECRFTSYLCENYRGRHFSEIVH